MARVGRVLHLMEVMSTPRQEYIRAVHPPYHQHVTHFIVTGAYLYTDGRSQW